MNKAEKRTGSLWKSRYKSSPISTNDYLLACCRYVELNPVRAGMVSDPAISSTGSIDSERFVGEIEEKIKRRVAFRGQGRPGKIQK